MIDKKINDSLWPGLTNCMNKTVANRYIYYITMIPLPYIIPHAKYLTVFRLIIAPLNIFSI